MTSHKFNLRDKVRDQITGFEGVIVVRSEFLNGCIRYGVQPIVLHKEHGTPQSIEHFDEEQLDLVEAVEKPKLVRQTGGDRLPARRHPDITR